MPHRQFVTPTTTETSTIIQNNPMDEKAVQGTNDDSILSKRSAVRHGYFKDPFVRYFTAKNPPRRSPMINRGYYLRMQVMESVVTSLLKRYAKQVVVTREKDDDQEETQDEKKNTAHPIQVLSLGAGFDTFACRNYMTNWHPSSSSSSSAILHANFFEVDFPSVMKQKVALMEQAMVAYNNQVNKTGNKNDDSVENHPYTQKQKNKTTTEKGSKEIPEEFLLTPIPFGSNEVLPKLVPTTTSSNDNKTAAAAAATSVLFSPAPTTSNQPQQQESANNKKSNKKSQPGTTTTTTTTNEKESTKLVDLIPTLCYSCDRYRCIGCDLRDLRSLEAFLVKNGFDFEAPTVVYAECVSQYMPRESSDALLRWISVTVKNAVFIGYDQIRDDDAFGKQMVASLKSRLSPLLGTVSGLNSCEALLHRATVSAASFRNARCVDFQQISNFILREKELQRVKDLEPFDEYEEWYIKCRHYSLLLGMTKNAEDWFENLIEDEIDKNLFFWKFSASVQQQQQKKPSSLPSDHPLISFHNSSHFSQATRTSTLEGAWNAVSSFVSSSSKNNNNNNKTIIVSFGGNMACAARLQPHEKVSPLFIFSVDAVTGVVDQIPVQRLKSSKEQQEISITTNNSSLFFPSQRYNASLTRIEPSREVLDFIHQNTNEDDDDEKISSATSSSSSPLAVFVLFGGRTSPSTPLSSEENSWLLVVHKLILDDDENAAASAGGDGDETNKKAIVSWIKIESSSSSSSTSSIPLPRSRHGDAPLIGNGKANHSSSFAICAGVDGKQDALDDIWIGEVVVAPSVLRLKEQQQQQSDENTFRSPQRNYASNVQRNRTAANITSLQISWTQLNFVQRNNTTKPSVNYSSMYFSSPNKTNESSSSTATSFIKPCISPQFVVFPKIRGDVQQQQQQNQDNDSETFFFFVSGGLDSVSGRIRDDNNFVGTVVAHQKILLSSSSHHHLHHHQHIDPKEGAFRSGPANTATFAQETLTAANQKLEQNKQNHVVEGRFVFKTFGAEHLEYNNTNNTSSSISSSTITPRFSGVAVVVEDLFALEAHLTPEQKVAMNASSRKSRHQQNDTTKNSNLLSTNSQSASKYYYILMIGGIFDDNIVSDANKSEQELRQLRQKRPKSNFCEVVEIIVPPHSYKGVVFPKIERTFPLRLTGIDDGNNNNEQQHHNEFISDFIKCNCILINNNNSNHSSPIPPTTNLLFFGGTYNCFSFGSFSPKPRLAQLHWDGNSNRSLRDGLIYNPQFENPSSRSATQQNASSLNMPEFQISMSPSRGTSVSTTTTSASKKSHQQRQQYFDERERQAHLEHEKRLQEIRDADDLRKMKLQALLNQYANEEKELERQRLEREKQLHHQRELAADQLRRLREQENVDEERLRKLEEEMEKRRREQERLLNEEKQVSEHLKRLSVSAPSSREASPDDNKSKNNNQNDENDDDEEEEDAWDEIEDAAEFLNSTNGSTEESSAAARRRRKRQRDLFHSDMHVTDRTDKYTVVFGRTTRPRTQTPKQSSSSSTLRRQGSISTPPTSPRNNNNNNAAISSTTLSSNVIISNIEQQKQQSSTSSPSSLPLRQEREIPSNRLLGVQLPPIREISPAYIIADLSEKNLTKVVEKLRVPVVFRTSSPLFDTSKWSDPSHIIKTEGDKVVSVHYSPKKSLDFVKKNFKFKHVKLGELIEHCCDPAAAAEETWYLRSVGENMRTEKTNFWQQFKNLGQELVLPDALAGSAYLTDEKLQQAVFRVNQAGMQLWTHYDVCDNFLLHCAGPKRFTFFPPSVHHAMYMDGSSSKVIEIDNPDLETYPRFLEARLQAFDVFLQPGDVLFVPALWFHRIECSEEKKMTKKINKNIGNDDDNDDKNTSSSLLPYSISVNLFFEKLPHIVYDAKDLYGNKDLPSTVTARAKVAKALREAISHIPGTDFKKFTLEQIMGDILELENQL